jgi:hypothetical protein
MYKRTFENNRDGDNSTKRATLDGLLVSIDFQRERFDGNYRDAHKFVPYCQDIFDIKRIAYVLDTTYSISRPEFLIMNKERDMERRKREHFEHDSRLRNWASGTEVAEWFRIAKLISELPPGQEKITAYDQHLARQCDLHLMFPEPTIPTFIPTISSSDEREIENYNREYKREKADADSILAVFKSTLGPTITTDLTSTWNDPTIPSILKARATWDYIKQYRTMNADAVVTQLKLDITQLPSAHTIQAAQHVYKQMAALQHQLITVGPIHAYADDELVSLCWRLPYHS